MGDNSHLAKSLFKSKAHIKSFGRDAASSLNSVGGAGMGAARMLGGLAGGLTFGTAVNKAMEYQSALNQIRVLGVKDMGVVDEAIRKTSMAYGIDLVQAATVAKDAISTFGTEGQGLSESLVFMQQASKASKAGYVDLGDAAMAVTGILKVFDLGTNSTISIMDKLKVATDLGITNMQRFAPEVSKLNVQFQVAGMGVDEMLSSLSAMTLVEQDVSRDSMMLTNLLKVLGGGNKDAAGAAKKLGLDFSATHLKAVGLAGATREVMAAVKGNDDALRRLFPDMDAYNGYVTYAKVVNTDYTRILGEVSGALGGTEEAFKNVMENDPVNAFSRLKEAFTGLATAAIPVDALTVSLNALADAISGAGVSDAVANSGWFKWATSGTSGMDMYYNRQDRVGEANYQSDVGSFKTAGQRLGLSQSKKQSLAAQAGVGLQNGAGDVNVTISNANFRGTDDMVKRYNRQAAMAPGV
jgi:hypothetical protein